MKTYLPATDAQDRPSGWSLLVRWLVLLLVAFDLMGAPLHAHGHSGEPAGLGSALHAEDISGLADGLHVEPVDAHGFSHSMTALLPAEMPTVSSHGLIDVVVLVALWAALSVLASAIRRTRPARERVPIRGIRHLRPDGRAPPLIHS